MLYCLCMLDIIVPLWSSSGRIVAMTGCAVATYVIRELDAAEGPLIRSIRYRNSRLAALMRMESVAVPSLPPLFAQQWFDINRFRARFF